MVLLVVLGGCGSFWVVLGRFGWFWVVPCFSNYRPRISIRRKALTSFSSEYLCASASRVRLHVERRVCNLKASP